VTQRSKTQTGLLRLCLEDAVEDICPSRGKIIPTAVGLGAMAANGARDDRAVVGHDHLRLVDGTWLQPIEAQDAVGPHRSHAHPSPGDRFHQDLFRR
jgi:hypothetical protein